jgi:hypothetical protein
MDTFHIGAIIILLWAISPYVFGNYIIMKSLENRAEYIVKIWSIFVGIAGLSLLIYAIYIEADAQSALAFIVVPLYQWGLLLLGTISMYFINKNIERF